MMPLSRLLRLYRHGKRAAIKSFTYELTLQSYYLPKTLKYVGEFGPELLLFLPFCAWLSKMGLLKNRRVETYYGMDGFYRTLLGHENFQGTRTDRIYVPPEHRPNWLPIRNEHMLQYSDRPIRHFYPDYRNAYSQYSFTDELAYISKPFLVIHNKYCSEWGSEPINFIHPAALDQIFACLKNEFQIIYIRHRGEDAYDSFSKDHNHTLHVNDSDVLDSHPDVLTLQSLYARHLEQGGKYDINTFKNALYSRCYRYISVQGGGAHHISLFSGSLLIVMHKKGQEESLSYRCGYYTFMARIPPVLAVCRSCEDLIDALRLFCGSKVHCGRIYIEGTAVPLLARFSPS